MDIELSESLIKTLSNYRARVFNDIFANKLAWIITPNDYNSFIKAVRHLKGKSNLQTFEDIVSRVDPYLDDIERFNSALTHNGYGSLFYPSSDYTDNALTVGEVLNHLEINVD